MTSGAAFRTHHDLVLGVLELGHGDDALVAPRRQQGRFVDEVHQVRAGEAGRSTGEHLQVHVGRERHLADMDAQDLLAADHVGVRHHDLAVEAARTQQRGVEHVGAVGRRDDDDAFVGLEAVHLDKELVQRLLALVVAAAEARTAMAADRVDFVDEDDAGRVLLGLLEHVAHAARADADEHLDEVGARDREERHIGFAGDGARRQRLAGAGRPDEQHAARNASAKALELLRVAQELHDLLQVFLGLVDAGDVLERHAAMRFSQQLGLRFAEAHGLSARALHLPGQEYPRGDEDDQRHPVDQQRQEPGQVLLQRLRREVHALLGELADEARVIGRVGGELAAIGQRAVDLRSLDDDVRHPARIHLAEELAVVHLVGRAALPGILEQRHEREHEKEDDHPKGEIPDVRIHYRSIALVRPGPDKALSGLVAYSLFRFDARHCQENQRRGRGDSAILPYFPSSHIHLFG